MVVEVVALLVKVVEVVVVVVEVEAVAAAAAVIVMVVVMEAYCLIVAYHCFLLQYLDRIHFSSRHYHQQQHDMLLLLF